MRRARGAVRDDLDLELDAELDFEDELLDDFRADEREDFPEAPLFFEVDLFPGLSSRLAISAP